MATMRAKMQVGEVKPLGSEVEILRFHGVCKQDGPYPADGLDENNTFAKFSPSVSLEIYIANPALIGQFKVGDTFYVDFTPVLP